MTSNLQYDNIVFNMSIELNEKPKAGVGALIVIPDRQQLLTIVEKDSNRPTNKLAGQIAIPMESMEPVDRDLRRAWRKLFKEEIKPVNFEPRRIDQILLDKIFLGQFELVPQVIVNFRAFIVSPEVKIVLGSATSEVTDLKWRRFDEVLDEPKGSLRFRPGVREAVEIFCFEYLPNPAQFQAGILRHNKLQDNIPQEAFNLIEKGLSVNEALSQLGIDGRLSASYPDLGH